jgi:hypothetical protein
MQIRPRKEQWLRTFGELHRQVEALDRTAAEVSHRHFWGEPSLFPAQAAAFECLNALMTFLVAGFSDVFPETAANGQVLHPRREESWSKTAPDKNVESPVGDLIKDLQVLAKAQALEVTGDREAGVVLTERHTLARAG